MLSIVFRSWLIRGEWGNLDIKDQQNELKNGVFKAGKRSRISMHFEYG